MRIQKYFFAALALVYCVSCAHDAHIGHDHDHTEHAGDHDDHDHDHDDHDHDGHDHDGHDKHPDGEIELSAARAAELGVVTDTVRLGSVNEVVCVTGEVITDPANQAVVVAPVSGRLALASGIREGGSVSRGQMVASVSGSELAGGDANRAARIELEAAKRELDRLKPLRDEGIVTAAEYNAALQAYDLARNAVGTGGGSARSPISGVIVGVDAANGQYVEAGAPIVRVAASGRLTVRADVPKRYASLVGRVRSATIKLPYTDRTVSATVAASPSDAAATTAYQPVYLNVSPASGLSAGSYVEVYLAVGEGRPGIKVPVSAVTERLGSKFVYVRVAPDVYERRPVTVGAVDGNDIEIVSGLTAGEVVVTSGTTFVRLAESANVAPQGHTHNH